jgi:hypothetical protein
MRTTMRRIPVTALTFWLVGALAGTAAGQSADGDAVFRALSAQTEKLRGVLGDREVLARIEEHVRVLEQARGAALGGRLAAEYRESLLADAALLESATARLQHGERERAVAAVMEVEADLAIKRRHLEAGVGMSTGALRAVNVTVRTLRGSREEPGHVVWFVPRGWSNDPRRYERFDGMSSPTSSERLAPGRYIMWAGEATGAGHQPIVIGGHGRSQQTVDLPLP